MLRARCGVPLLLDEKCFGAVAVAVAVWLALAGDPLLRFVARRWCGGGGGAEVQLWATKVPYYYSGTRRI